jgi:antitoxin component HigA of HigAB toxin-antitoxin module
MRSLRGSGPPQAGEGLRGETSVTTATLDFTKPHVLGPAAVRFMLEQKGLERSDLDEVMGGRSRVSEFLNGKRDLSQTQIEGLRRMLGIPADVLLGLDP